MRLVILTLIVLFMGAPTVAECQYGCAGTGCNRSTGCGEPCRCIGIDDLHDTGRCMVLR